MRDDVTRPIAAQIEEAVAEIPGWTPLDQLLSLFALAFSSAHLRGDILELGSWCGRSAVALGMAARLTGRTTVHCVDLFPEKDDWYQNANGTYSFSVTLGDRTCGAYREQTVWEEPFLRDIAPMYERWPKTLDAFNHFISKHQLDSCVRAYKTDLGGFAGSTASEPRLRLAFIDGDHGFDAVCRDIELLEKLLLPGGWICFDDAFSTYAGVDDAIKEKIVNSGKYQLCQQLTRKFFAAQKL